MRRLKYFSRKRPVTAQPSLALTAANSVSRRITETRARKRARNSYIRDHEHPPGSTHRAGYELITTEPRPRTAVFRGRGNRQAGTTDGGSRRDPPQLRRRRNRWRVRQRICLGTCPTGKGAELVHVPAAVHVARIGLPARAGTRPDSIDHAMPTLACFVVHVSCQQAPAATDTFPRSAASTFIRL